MLRSTSTSWSTVSGSKVVTMHRSRRLSSPRGYKPVVFVFDVHDAVAGDAVGQQFGGLQALAAHRLAGIAPQLAHSHPHVVITHVAGH